MSFVNMSYILKSNAISLLVHGCHLVLYNNVDVNINIRNSGQYDTCTYRSPLYYMIIIRSVSCIT